MIAAATTAIATAALAAAALAATAVATSLAALAASTLTTSVTRMLVRKYMHLRPRQHLRRRRPWHPTRYQILRVRDGLQ